MDKIHNDINDRWKIEIMGVSKYNHDRQLFFSIKTLRFV